MMATNPTLKIGARGPQVVQLQQRLALIPDGIFGPITAEAVKAFQKSKALIPDGIVGPLTWDALGVSPVNPRFINRLIIHCAATPEDADFSAADIRRWHLARGFSDIGYHYVIYLDGRVVPGRDESLIGAHTTGYNANSIGICYVGGLAADGKTPKDTRTAAQRKALLDLLRALKTKYPAATIHGHNEFAAKACPSFDVRKDQEICAIK